MSKVQTEVKSGSAVSPFAYAKLVGERTNREIKPQMIYNYVKAGRIPSSTNDKGRLVIDVKAASEWLDTFAEKNGVPSK